VPGVEENGDVRAPRGLAEGIQIGFELRGIAVCGQARMEAELAQRVGRKGSVGYRVLEPLGACIASIADHQRHLADRCSKCWDGKAAETGAGGDAREGLDETAACHGGSRGEIGGQDGSGAKALGVADPQHLHHLRAGVRAEKERPRGVWAGHAAGQVGQGAGGAEVQVRGLRQVDGAWVPAVCFHSRMRRPMFRKCRRPPSGVLAGVARRRRRQQARQRAGDGHPEAGRHCQL
jgi:hypothetical protein